MSERIRRATSICLLIAGVFLSGICLSEGFGYFQDSPESTDQTIEQAFSSPVDRVVSPDNQPGNPTFTGPLAFAAADSLQGIAHATSSLLILKHLGPPTNPKRFHLLSIYRI